MWGFQDALQQAPFYGRYKHKFTFKGCVLTFGVPQGHVLGWSGQLYVKFAQKCVSSKCKSPIEP